MIDPADTRTMLGLSLAAVSGNAPFPQQLHYRWRKHWMSLQSFG